MTALGQLKPATTTAEIGLYAGPDRLQRLIEGAKKEGALTVYSSMNEEEGLPLWRVFEGHTGIKIEYVRGSDTQLIARMAIENRAGRVARRGGRGTPLARSALAPY